ncbi:MAG TPA: hypothetical protein VGA37_00830 [Gemmatimonadales bacterium]
MFRVRASLAIVLGAVLSIGCGDGGGPEGNTGQFRVDLVFANNADNVVAIASASVLAKRDNGTTALDTTLAITDSTDGVFTVPISGGSETFEVTLTLRNAAGTAVFQGGPLSITISEGTTPSTVQITMTYVGPGADATSVEITSTDSVVAVMDTLTVTAVARDGSDNTINGAPIGWRSTNPALADFPDPAVGRLVAQSGTGTLMIIAQAVTGPADTMSIRVAPATANLLAEALGAFEDAAYVAINNLEDIPDLDLFSFEDALDLFEQALTADPTNQTAAFGAAVTTVLVLEDNATVRSTLDGWKSFVDNNGFDALFYSDGPFPPTFAQHQATVRDIVLPAVLAGLDYLNMVTDPAFVFTLTEGMQGDSGIGRGPLDIDQTEVLAMRAGLQALLGVLNTALAYRADPSPFSPTGFDAAWVPGSTFLTLAADGGVRLAEARNRFRTAVDLAQDAVDHLVAETDPQDNDFIKYDAGAQSGEWTGIDSYFGPADITDMEEVLTSLGGMLDGPQSVRVETLGRNSSVPLTIDATRFFLNPITDLKTLLPPYQTGNGSIMWEALAFDQWILPDPSANGILPGITTTDTLNTFVDLTGLWEQGRLYFDAWSGITQAPGDGATFALDQAGLTYEMASDFSSQVTRPTVNISDPPMWSIGRNSVTGELVALSYQSIYTRPDDPATGWTARIEGFACCGATVMTEDPSGDGTMWVANSSGSLWQIPSDFSTATVRPEAFVSIDAFTANDQTGQLVALSWDGLLNARPADAVTAWSQVGFLLTSGWESRWVGITQAPAGSALYAITVDGDLREISGDYATVIQRPVLPVTDVFVLTSNRATGELVALTLSGRVFTRPPDAATGWTQRTTLPVTIR